MNDLLAQGGAAGAGTFFGALASWIGFKQRIDAQDKKLETLSDSVMYEDTCTARTNGLEKRIEDQNALLTEMRKDIKQLLRKTP